MGTWEEMEVHGVEEGWWGEWVLGKGRVPACPSCYLL